MWTGEDVILWVEKPRAGKMTNCILCRKSTGRMWEAILREKDDIWSVALRNLLDLHFDLFHQSLAAKVGYWIVAIFSALMWPFQGSVSTPSYNSTIPPATPCSHFSSFNRLYVFPETSFRSYILLCHIPLSMMSLSFAFNLLRQLSFFKVDL